MARSKVTPELTGPLLRAARALAGMSAADLAGASKVGLRTIRRAEQEEGIISLTEPNKAALEAALEGKGVILVQTSVGPGVAHKKGR